MKPLQNGLIDPSPYVRKTAVVGCLKLFHLSPKRVRGMRSTMMHAYANDILRVWYCKQTL